ncbi:MAG: hypothetical protein LUH05_02510 [Candidatus Gastranaerophilales bacterium]|nr:hypothetical protein [Candidatus Gastranaerophilales bacterium]
MNVLNSYNQLFSSELQSSPSEGKIRPVSKSETPKQADKKKLAYSAAAAVGITALCAVGIYLGKIKPKNTVEQITDITQDGIGKLLKENDKLTGKFSKTLKDGSKVVIEYSDGILQKTTKTAADGTQIFEKVYSKTVNGDLLVNNKNITEISNQAKKHQEDFISLIKKQDSSLDELQSFDRKNLSKKQIGELDGKIKAKKEAVELETKKQTIKAEKSASEQAVKVIEESQSSLEKQAKPMPNCSDYIFSLADKQGNDTRTCYFFMNDKKYAITLDKDNKLVSTANCNNYKTYSYAHGSNLKSIQIDGEEKFAKRIKAECWKPDHVIDPLGGGASSNLDAAMLCLEDKGLTQEQIVSLIYNNGKGSTMSDLFQDGDTYAQYQIKAAYNSVKEMQEKILKECKAQPEGGTLYRAMDLNDSSELSKLLRSSLSKGDKAVLQYNPMYTTPDFNYLTCYKNTDILKINVPKGAHIACDGETLLPGMSEFEFVKRNTIGDINFYELNYIPFENTL